MFLGVLVGRHPLPGCLVLQDRVDGLPEVVDGVQEV